MENSLIGLALRKTPLKCLKRRSPQMPPCLISCHGLLSRMRPTSKSEVIKTGQRRVQQRVKSEASDERRGQFFNRVFPLFSLRFIIFKSSGARYGGAPEETTQMAFKGWRWDRWSLNLHPTLASTSCGFQSISEALTPFANQADSFSCMGKPFYPNPQQTSSRQIEQKLSSNIRIRRWTFGCILNILLFITEWQTAVVGHFPVHCLY